MNQDCGHTRFNNLINMLLLEYRFTVDNHFITFDRNDLACILVYKIFHPCLQHTSSQFTTNIFLQICLVDLNLFSQIENLKNILVVFKTDSSQQGCYGQLLLTINVCIHHIIYVCCKLNPRALKRNDTCRIELRTIRMYTLPKEHTRWTMQLWDNNTFCTVDDESTIIGHIRNRTEKDIFYHGVKILMIRIGTI